jgi:glycosyltransferase involved in cell wall biosynthesis
LVKRRHAISENAMLVLFVGALDRAHYFKGADYLLRVFSKIEDDDTVLVIVGDGDLKEQLMALTGELGMAHRVCFAGAVPHSQLGPYYAAADIVILPSFPPESFGVVLIEAMACGKPVIAHDIPGVRSVVRDGVDGLLARPNEAHDLLTKVQALLGDPFRRRQMGEQGRANAESKYAWPKVVSRLVQVYESAMATDDGDH